MHINVCVCVLVHAVSSTITVILSAFPLLTASQLAIPLACCVACHSAHEFITHTLWWVPWQHRNSSVRVLYAPCRASALVAHIARLHFFYRWLQCFSLCFCSCCLLLFMLLLLTFSSISLIFLGFTPSLLSAEYSSCSCCHIFHLQLPHLLLLLLIK